MRRHAAQRIALGSRAVYIIRIQGFLDQQWQAEMGNLHIASYLRGDGSVSPVTILVGEVADQAALEGIRISATDVRSSDVTLWDLRLNRDDLFNAPGGPVGFATGVEWRRDSYHDDRDPRLDGSQPFDNGAIFDESDIIGVSATFDSKASRNSLLLWENRWVNFATT